jgi:HEPN domain-containing protein
MPLPISDLRAIAQARLDDAQVLLSAGKPDGAAYLCGYAVELSLKACICRTLGWAAYPATSKEFQDYKTFKTHVLDVLLHLSGRELFVKENLLAEWSAIATWDPEARYQPVGKVKAGDAQSMVEAAATLLGKI